LPAAAARNLALWNKRGEQRDVAPLENDSGSLGIAGSWGIPASLHCEGMLEAGCGKKRLKNEFFSALAYFHCEAVHKPQKNWAFIC
jgi:hypothetical protein